MFKVVTKDTGYIEALVPTTISLLCWLLNGLKTEVYDLRPADYTTTTTLPLPVPPAEAVIFSLCSVINIAFFSLCMNTKQISMKFWSR